MFKDVPTHFNFSKTETEILGFWKHFDIFHKSLKQREGAPRFVFFEGPPTANGIPHNGHVLTRVIKDLFPRYKTMRGYSVPRKAGWDTHGLPVEVEVEKELGIKGRQAISEYGLEKFNRHCVSSVFKYTDTWEKLTDRVGFWVDLPDAYVTYHRSYVESVWWALSELFNKGLLYEGHKIIWWWAQGGTALSSAEVGLGYKETADPSVFVRCPVVGTKDSLLVWTTTPWTLFDNTFVAVKPDLEYAYVTDPDGDGSQTLIIASALVEKVAASSKKELTVLKTVKGSELLGLRYQPPFDGHFKRIGHTERKLKDGGMESSYWRVVPADFVTLDSGTGLVHQAPAFGEVDFDVFQRETQRYENPPELLCAVESDGKFSSLFADVAGIWVKEADKTIIRLLKDKGILFHREQYIHNYPYCWRSDDDPLIQYPRKGWFIRTTKEIKSAIKNNQAINWLPKHIQDGRFGDFLDNNIDWALSRERFWGTPLNIWVCDKCGAKHAPASVNDIETLNPHAFDSFKKDKAADPTLTDHLMVHKPWIDQVSFQCISKGCGGTMRRVPEVIDCWFDSGCMPFAQWGFPNTQGSVEQFRNAFPADFISEAIDQTRGWFYSLLMISTLVFDEQTQKEYGIEPHREFPHPYKNCIVLGHVCDMDGRKESKSKGNYTSPDVVLEGFLKLKVIEPLDGKYPPRGIAFLLPELVKSLALDAKERVLMRAADEAIDLTATAPMLHAKLAPGASAKESVVLNDEDRQRLGIKVGQDVRLEMPFDPPGADAFRWLFYASSPVWNNTRNSLRAIRDGQKDFLIKLRNVYSFFVIYANIDGFDPSDGASALSNTTSAKGYRPVGKRAEMDRWILSELNLMLREVVRYMDSYLIYDAARELNAFVEILSNWYLRRNRSRFWASGFDVDKYDAYWTLWEALVKFSQAAAPFIPFMTEQIYQNLARTPFKQPDAAPESVHLCDYPLADETLIDAPLSARMALARRIATLGLAARAAQKIKVRQPLASAQVLLANPADSEILESLLPVVRDELNVKTIAFPNDAAQYVSWVVNPNFRTIGPKFGQKVPQIKAAVGQANAAQLKSQLDETGKIALQLGDGSIIELTADEVEISLKAKGHYAAASEKGVVVALDIEISESLKMEGEAREIINRIQTARKDIGFDFADKIKVSIVGSARLADVIAAHKDYICGETLCVAIQTKESLGGDPNRLEIEVEGEKAVMCVEKQ